MNHTQGLVSVIVPAFNAAPYVTSAVTSALNQTYPDVEIIVVDDASSDETVEAVRALKDDRVRLICHDRNYGPGAARNTGVEAARGRWIAFLDADDQMQRDRLQRLVRAITVAGEGFFVADDEWVCHDEPGVLTGVRRHLAGFKLDFGGREYLDLELRDYQHAGCPHLHALVPAAVVKLNSVRFPTDCHLGEDLEFYCSLFQLGLRLRLLASAGYLYRVTPGSISSDPARVRDLARVYRRLADDSRLGMEERRYFAAREKKLGREEEFLRVVSLVRSCRLGAGLLYATCHPRAVLECLRRVPDVIRRRCCRNAR